MKSNLKAFVLFFADVENNNLNELNYTLQQGYNVSSVTPMSSTGETGGDGNSVYPYSRSLIILEEQISQQLGIPSPLNTGSLPNSLPQQQIIPSPLNTGSPPNSLPQQQSIPSNSSQGLFPSPVSQQQNIISNSNQESFPNPVSQQQGEF